jgi:hypothetical protein
MAQVFRTISHVCAFCRRLFGWPLCVSPAVLASVSADASRNCLILLICVDVLAADHEACAQRMRA